MSTLIGFAVLLEWPAATTKSHWGIKKRRVLG